MKFLDEIGLEYLISMVKSNYPYPSNIITKGHCLTAAATSSKIVNITSEYKFALVPGCVILVEFTYTNTNSYPTLNVNNTGAYPVRTLRESNSPEIGGHQSRKAFYMYESEDGGSWIFLGYADGGKTQVVLEDPTQVSLWPADVNYIQFNYNFSGRCLLTIEDAPLENVEDISIVIDIYTQNAEIEFDDTINWNGTPTFTQGKHYEISIKCCNGNYYGVWNSWNI